MMTTPPTASATGTAGDGATASAWDAALGGGATGTWRGGAAVVSSTVRVSEGTSDGSTRCPTPWTPAGTENPQSSSRAACWGACSGRFSVSITLTTRRRPLRSAAVTNVWRAASVKPVLPPRSPG
jgi:hypothetical protein